MEFGILGPLRVTTEDGERPVGSAKVRTVLALLVVRANQTVSTDTLVDALWEQQPPRSAVTTLQTYVYQLRKSLELDTLLTRPTGYTLEIERTAVDAQRFEDALRESTGAAPNDVAIRLGEALALWRGRALADFDGAAWARVEAARLDALRLDAIERMIDARLELGEHRAVVPELESLVDAHPLRERFWAQLMLALYRSDRQADALRAYTRLREHLRDELGLEPSRDLEQLEAAILAHAPELAGPAPVETAAVEAGPASPARPGAPGRRHAWVAAAIAIGAIAIVGVVLMLSNDNRTSAVARPAGYTPTYRSASCPPTIAAGSASVTCGILTVPESRDRPGGRKIELGVFRYPTRVSEPTDDPVVQIASDFRLAQPADEPTLRARSDSIYVTGRGFFGSTPRLTCPEVEDAVRASLARPLRDPVNTQAFVLAATRCRARWATQHVDLSAYSAAERADDVRDLALVLHLKQINLVAAGPMTNDAREVAGRYPALVRSITLFNVTPQGSATNRWNGAITNAAGALDRFVGECTNDPGCDRAYPHLRQRLVDLYDRAQRAPKTFMVSNPYAEEDASVPILIDGDRAMQITLHALHEPSALALIPQAFVSATSGQAAADFAASRLIAPRDASWGALLSRVCIDEMAGVGRGGIDLEGQAAPLVAFIADDPLLAVCDAWKTAPAATHAPGPGVVPTLILQGDLDPFTSREWALQVAQSFGSATIVQLSHLGQVASSGDPCVLRLQSRFLADPQRPIRADSCARSIPPVRFAGT